MNTAGFYLDEVTPTNAQEKTFFCIKDVKSDAFKAKLQWFEERYREGLRIHILKDETNRMIGFIEWVPAKFAWRPLDAPDYLFIHCLYVYSKKDRNQGLGTLLLAAAEREAKAFNMKGLCVMTSKGSWIANKDLFMKNGFTQVDQRGRFELLVKKWEESVPDPQLLDWTQQQKQYKGWHLVYADQCPWHEKSVVAMQEVAQEFGVDLQVTKMETAEAAQQAPSGFGVFNLLHDGKLLEDHYLSATRFKSILTKELLIR